jgi:prepilin-type N-terminal cleavage/methylation domain-containing protein
MRKGFTLLELSIVLVIIGLIVGGVVAGQSLIRGAELQNIMSDVDEYKMAILTFKMKYGSEPGDIANAYDYWPAGCTSAGFCNGDGDGVRESGRESARAWLHMSLAGLISGTYTGDYSSGWVIGTTGPAAAKDGTGFAMNWVPLYGEQRGNYLELASMDSAGAANYPDGAALVPSDAYAIDLKLDDGLPTSGRIYGLYRAASAWVDGECQTNFGSPLRYYLAKTAPGCRLWFF